MPPSSTLPFWEKPVLNTDVVIVGGGLMGVGLAYQLASSGIDCALFERGNLGAAASGRNDGQIIQDTVDFYPRMKAQYGSQLAQDFLRFKTKGQENLHSFLLDQDVPEQIAYHLDGSLNLAINEAEAIQIEASIEALCADGFIVERIEKDDIEEKIGTRAFNMAKWNPGDATVNPMALTQWLGALATSQGCQVYDHCPVLSIEEDAVVHAHGKTNCSLIVVACNAYSSQLMPWFEQKIFPVRGQVMATKPTDKNFPSIGCITNFGYDYWHWAQDGRLIIGGKRTIDEENEKGFEHRHNKKVQDALADFMTYMYPDMGTVPIANQWSGIMGFSADGLPLVGPISGKQNLWSMAGFTGYGLGLFWPITKAVCDALMGEKTEGSSFLPNLTPSRFL